jgi:chorismate-pyruvate lyase
MINELRLGQDGIGMIIIKHKIETYKKIIKIGYNLEKNSIFRTYKLFYKYQNICEINEKFMFKIGNSI